MEKCARCSRTEEEVRLFDGIYVTDSVKICERCSIISNIPIIKRPSADQLKDSEKSYIVRERLMKMNHLDNSEKKVKSPYEQLKEIDSKPELEQPEDLVFKLVDNYHWIIQTERRRKGITTKQLADSLGESESAIKLLEKGIIPSGALNLITAIEQFLKIKLVKKDFMDKINEQKNQLKNTNSIIYRKSDPVVEKNLVSEMKKEETNDMVKQAIINEQNVRLKKIESSGGYPLPASEFRKKDGQMSISELRKINEVVEKDLTTKSREEVGREQVENLGKEDTAKIRRTIFKDSKSKVPTIYDLMKKKEERDKTSLTGKDIDILE